MNSNVKDFLLCKDGNLQQNYSLLLKAHRDGLDAVCRNVAEWQFKRSRTRAIKGGVLDHRGNIPRPVFRNEPRFI